MIDNDLIIKSFLKELYGITLEELEELDRLCRRHKVDWFNLFYSEEEIWDVFIEYFIKKYKLSPKRVWRNELNYLMLNWGPTFSKERYEEAIKKVKEDRTIQTIIKKAKLFDWKEHIQSKKKGGGKK